MAYRIHDKFVMGGRLTTDAPGEIWACTINGLFNGGTAAPADYQAWADAIRTPLASWFNNSSNQMRNDSTLDYVKLNRIGVDGKYPTGWTSIISSLATPAVGGSGSLFPGFLSVAISWKTDIPRGPGANGRIYPPSAFTSSSASDRITAATALTFANAGKALITLLSATYSSTLAFVPTVESNVGAKFSPIRKVRVGNVIDVQRRRKNKLPETYTTVTV